MRRMLYVIFVCFFIISIFTGCLENDIHIQASAHRLINLDTGFPQAIFIFNISNLGHYDIQDITLEIIFFKINEYELSKKLVNSTFQINWSILTPGETGYARFETYLDPALAPSEVMEMWNGTVHWQMTFKIKWDEKKTHITTQTFNWYFN